MSLIESVKAEVLRGTTGAESIARELGTDTFLVERALARLESQQLFISPSPAALGSCSDCKVSPASAGDDAAVAFHNDVALHAGLKRGCAGCPLAC